MGPLDPHFNTHLLHVHLHVPQESSVFIC